MGRSSSRAVLAALLLFAACARAPVTISPIVDIPAKPDLPECVLATGQGRVKGEEVVFDLPAIEAFAQALKAERVCHVARETLLEGWGQKLENRLRAVTGSQ